MFVETKPQTMTREKIAHYIGEEKTAFILSQSVEKLEEMKKALLYEFNEVQITKICPEISFRYTIELELIKGLLFDYSLQVVKKVIGK